MGPGGPHGQGQMGPGNQGQMGPGASGTPGQLGPHGRGPMGRGGLIDRGGPNQMGPGGPRGPAPIHQHPGPGGPGPGLGQMRGPNMGPGTRGSEDEDLRRRDQDFRQPPPNQERWQQNQQDNFGGGSPFSSVHQDQDFRTRPESEFHRGDEDMRFVGHAGRQGSGRGGRDGWNEEYRDFDERRGGGRGGEVQGRGGRGGGMAARQDTDYRFSQQPTGFDPAAENWDGDQGRGPPKNMRGFHQEGGFEAFSSGDRDERGNREQSPHQRGPSQYSQPDGMRKRTYEEGPGRGRGNSTPNLSRGGSGSYRGHHGSGQHSDHIDSHGPKYGRHDSPTDFGDQYSGHSQRPGYGPPRGRGRGSRGRGDYRSPRYRGGSGRGAQRGQ